MSPTRLLAALLALAAAPAGAAGDDTDARLGIGLLAAGAAAATGTMAAYQLLSADAAGNLDDDWWPFRRADGEGEGPTRAQAAGVLGVSGGAVGVVLLLTGLALLAGAGALGQGDGGDDAPE